MSCSINQCGMKVKSRNYCTKHLQKLYKYGDPTYKHVYKSNLDSDYITSRITFTELDSCWNWVKAKDKQGYGVLKMFIDGTNIHFAHRLSYSIYIGPLDKSLVIDHLCENKSCVNPFHLEQVTSGENVRRAFDNRNGTHTHCVRGHEWTEANTAYYGKVKNKTCKKCNIKHATDNRRKKDIDNRLCYMIN